MLHTPHVHALDFRNGTMRDTAGVCIPDVGKQASSDPLDVEGPIVVVTRVASSLVSKFNFKMRGKKKPKKNGPSP